MKTTPLLVAALLVPLAGCKLPEDELGIVRVIWNEFPWWSVLWRLTAWSVLGAFAGFCVGVGGSLLLRRLGAYRLPWRRTGYWLRFAILTLNLLLMPLLFGFLGYLEGIYQSGAVAVRHSVIGKEWLPAIAEVGADAICLADRNVEKDQMDFDDWEEVHQQKRSINVVRFLERLDRLTDQAADRIGAHAKGRIFEENPAWKGEVTESIIDGTLPPLVNYLLHRELHGRLKEYGVPDLLSEMRAEAVKDGDELLTHEELTRFLTDRVLIRMVLNPLRKWVTTSQITMLIIVVAVFAVPVVLIGSARWINFWWKRRQIRHMCGDRL